MGCRAFEHLQLADCSEWRQPNRNDWSTHLARIAECFRCPNFAHQTSHDRLTAPLYRLLRFAHFAPAPSKSHIAPFAHLWYTLWRSHSPYEGLHPGHGMRKLFQDHQRTQHDKYRARKSKKARLRHKVWLLRANRESQARKVHIRKRRLEAHDPLAGYRRVAAPRVFSFINEPEHVSKFVAELSTHFEKSNRVFVVLRNVEIIDYSAIVVLLSIMVQFKTRNIRFNGDYPANQVANKVLQDSGFFKILSATIKERDTYEINTGRGDGIFTHSMKRVDSRLTAQLIEAASLTICGEPRVRKGVQRSLIELMMNTHNHADRNVPAAKNWWMSVHHDLSAKRVSFAFVDYGIGVFSSLQNKSPKSKFFDWQRKIVGKLTFSNNAEFLRKILQGDLHATVTKMPFRGKGLPGIMQAMKRNSFSRLHVITNDVFANVEDDNFRTLNAPFEGTFVYWEVGEKND